MADLVVGPLISLVMEKVCNYLLDQYKVMKGMEKERKILERKLPAILDIIQDAEEKGAFRPGVAAWLKDLKAVAYDANNAFDEFSYEALRREANKKGHHGKLGMEVVLIARNPIVFRYRMGKKLRKIVQTVEVLVSEMNTFGFRHLQQVPPSNQWRDTDSILVDSDKEIVSRSREREKNRIVGMLLHEASSMDLMVLPVVGMGGLGKTSFAQLIYNDPEIEKHFELRRWCCVSDDFDAANIASNICETNPNPQGREETFKALLNLISGMRCLIVLDDVWNRDEAKWGKLVTCLKQGGKGSAVLTTTRDAEVARIMKLGVAEAYTIEKLSPGYLKEIVQSRALGLQKPNSDELDGIVDTIVDRCSGSPLAAKAFGSILSTKTTLNEWKDIAATGHICNERTGILPILKLSFDNLPSYMKQCFAFCAIFPKDYEIDVELLIQLWMAHDFIPVHEDQQPETVGEEIFRELTWRSFFEQVKQTSRQYNERLGLRKRTICKIHDLMHDIALSVMGKESATVVDTPSLKLLPNTSSNHLFFSHSEVALTDKFSKKQSAKLRTLFCTEFSDFHHISKCSALRVLHLPLQAHEVRVSHLQHLRYLNLSGNRELKEFPELIVMYNLQTLNLSHCSRLCQLPKAMRYMPSLRHIYTTGCKSLTSMPPGLGQMTTLQNLTYFAVGASSDCSTIGELQNLNLGGELELNGLENATETLAKAASLESKEKLTHLSLQWNSEDQEEQEQDSQKKVLFALRPHGYLLMLRILNYKGNILPSWITDLNMMQHLTELHLRGCMFCVEYPQFCHMKALQVLYLEKLEKLRFLSRDTASVPFPALKEVQLHDLEVLETFIEGEEDEVTFPELELLDIKNCPNLTSLPYSPKLKVMKLDEHKALLSLAVLKSRQVFSLSDLQLHVPDAEATPPQIDENHESSLSKLSLEGCHFFFSSSQKKFAAWNWFRKVVYLKICCCDEIVNWPEDVLQGLVSLKYLGFYSCNKLIGPAQENGDEPAQTMRQNQPFLNTIEIANCESFTELFTLPISRCIILYDCPRLQALWGEEEQPETLESLCLNYCGSLVTIPNLPTSLKDLQLSSCGALRSLSGNLDALEELYIYCCDELQSLDSLGELPSLARMRLESCKNLASLPTGSYSALQQLTIKYCPAIDMKGFYKCHQQRLDSLEVKHLSHAHSSDPREGPKLREPKTWLYAVPQCLRLGDLAIR
ncbi:unnamed protein product [Urochloa humidicola]